MIITIFKHYRLILDMSGTELRRKYAGTLLGPFWSIAPQVLTVITYWFVFELGLKIRGTGSIPYFYYFALGILPWFLFFDAFSSSVNAVKDSRYLITKMVFPSEILPVVIFLVASVPHVVLVGVLAGMLWSIQLLTVTNLPWLIYFYLCGAVLAVGAGLLVSSISVFSRDVAQFSQMAISLIFWITPIMWKVDALPTSWHWAFEWNPLTYIVDGYRFALAGGMFPDLVSGAKFWLVSLSVAALGRYVFLQLKHHFADVL
jgi:ABC-type polysaccharide/polyol phosphate export permease